MSLPAFPIINTPCISNMRIRKTSSRRIYLRGNSDKVNMIAHHAACPCRNTISRTGSPYVIQIRQPIFIGKEYVKPAIAALNDVMRISGNYYPG